MYKIRALSRHPVSSFSFFCPFFIQCEKASKLCAREKAKISNPCFARTWLVNSKHLTVFIRSKKSKGKWNMQWAEWPRTVDFTDRNKLLLCVFLQWVSKKLKFEQSAWQFYLNSCSSQNNFINFHFTQTQNSNFLPPSPYSTPSAYL